MLFNETNLVFVAVPKGAFDIKALLGEQLIGDKD